MEVRPLVLVHLSDIHFNKRGLNDAYDLDRELRDELELDARRMAEKLGAAHGVLVTGDIAFAGQPAEFEFAASWLETLTSIVGCEMQDVWTAPGNHDVDRGVAAGSEQLKMVHARLRSAELSDLDRLIADFMRDPIGVDVFASLAAYNEFAAPFQSRITRAQPNWHGDLVLNDGSVLRLWGLNSTLTSWSGDAETGDERLILGTYQTTFPREEGVEYLTLCHHPPPWMRDGERAGQALAAKARLQLYGHRHSHAVAQVDNSVVISAGAVHPGRGEGAWAPHYNWITVGVAESETKRVLEIEVFPRSWSESRHVFDEHPDDGSLKYQLSLDRWSRADVPATTVELGESEEQEVVSGSPQERTDVLGAQRKLHYRYLRLPYVTAVRIAQKLSLVEDDDRLLSGADLFNTFLRRAKERDLLVEFEAEVRGAERSD